MADRLRFRINSPQVIGETVDAEVIIVNLGTATYYSVKGDSILLWNAIVEGATLDELAEAVVAATDASYVDAARAVEGFRASLVAEGLIAERDDDVELTLDLAGGGSGLLEPSFEAYSDMQDLVLLDPVHQVDDERGWPHTQSVA
jgi:hypothetical protein